MVVAEFAALCPYTADLGLALMNLSRFGHMVLIKGVNAFDRFVLLSRAGHFLKGSLICGGHHGRLVCFACEGSIVFSLWHVVFDSDIGTGEGVMIVFRQAIIDCDSVASNIMRHCKFRLITSLYNSTFGARLFLE